MDFNTHATKHICNTDNKMITGNSKKHKSNIGYSVESIQSIC